MMRVKYIKRFQMVYDFTKIPPPSDTLPRGFGWVTWRDDILAIHARVMFESFRNTIDATLFPTFSQHDRCLRLMESIASNSYFEPMATMLITHNRDDGAIIPIAGIQGFRLDQYCGAIQNVGVIPEYRGYGFGKLLLAGCLNGFYKISVNKVSLEATADNHRAVKVYKKVGFETLKVVFKETTDS
ncbi:MAG: GNAT family N-acetyltransferase [Planctomycetaceae bacterium]|jgi:ribosomal protein S18 acetylase RimI-like enzyme|nr:GNAT family N-acetyltransferase [Planctomycetaceae bacterium]